MANSAPNQIYKDVIMSLPLEKHTNYNSGYDVKIATGAKFEFFLKLSTEWYEKRMSYKGWNPVWGIIVSDRGRKSITVTRTIVTKNGTRTVGGIPIPVDESRTSTKDYDHPTRGRGYNDMYADSKVAFVKTLRAIQGTNWIRDAVENSKAEVIQALKSGDTKFLNMDTGTVYR